MNDSLKYICMIIPAGILCGGLLAIKAIAFGGDVMSEFFGGFMGIVIAFLMLSFVIAITEDRE